MPAKAGIHDFAVDASALIIRARRPLHLKDQPTYTPEAEYALA